MTLLHINHIIRTHFVSTHSGLDVSTADGVVARLLRDLLDEVAGQLEYIRRHVLDDGRHVRRHRRVDLIQEDLL